MSSEGNLLWNFSVGVSPVSSLHLFCSNSFVEKKITCALDQQGDLVS